jgi:hypothetical protein
VHNIVLQTVLGEHSFDFYRSREELAEKGRSGSLVRRFVAGMTSPWSHWIFGGGRTHSANLQ